MEEENKINNSEIKDSDVKASEVSESKIQDSKVEDSEISDSKIIDSEVIKSEVKDSEIKDSKIVENEVVLDSSELIEQRKKKAIEFLKNRQLWVFGLLIIAVILGVYIRSMPMHDHGGNPGLWDITRNSWTLGPDLDPWLFLRQAEVIVEQGSLPKIDMMRNVPLGFDNSVETQLLPHMITWTHSLVNLFGDYNIHFAGAIFPVIMFGLTIISFFLFVREVFIRKEKSSIIRANIIALISTFFMIVIPALLSRTIAGIPEKESAAFFFMFLSLYLFLKAWKSEKLKIAIIFSILAAISTAAIGLIWGGSFYVFISIAMASLIAFVLNKIKKKELFVYTVWSISSLILLVLFSNRFTMIGLVTSLNTGLVFLGLFIFWFHFIFWNIKLSKPLQNIKLPKNIISLILGLILLIILTSALFGSGFVMAKARAIHQNIFQPTTGRWNVTVAENRQPFFTEWAASFGPFIKNVPVLFWLFFIGSVVLFKNMLKKIKNKDAWVLTLLYIFFFFGLVFSRYSATSVFNGSNFVSKLFYYGSAILLIGTLLYYYLKYHKENRSGFESVEYEYLILLSLFVLGLFTARGAVRLIMVLAPIAPIFVGYLIIRSIDMFREFKDETAKIIMGLIVIIILMSSIFVFWNFYNGVKIQSYHMIPGPYNQQWQKAMQWVRDETPEDAVFSHWWDYGYWLQSIGRRATVLDGGNAIAYWNYLMGRHVLTGDNQDDALEFLYNHNATHFLIDSTDIGKYTAFSSIGSDEKGDRFSWIGTFLLNEKQTQETKDQTVYFYSGGVGLDEDLKYEKDGQEIFLPEGMAGVGAILLPVNKQADRFSQPSAIYVYQGVQHKIDLKYLYVGGEFIEFDSGIEACAYVMPSLNPQGQGITQNPIGAVTFLSPRLMRGMLAQVYFLDDALDNFPNFKLTHTESDLMIDSLQAQGMQLPEFVFYQGIRAPIKIWEIEYTGKEEIRQEYIDTDPTKYLDWQL